VGKSARRAALALLLVVLWASGCEDPVAVFTGITAESTEDAGHRHRATIPRQDIDAPPADGRSYATTSDAAHDHTVRLTKAQLEILQRQRQPVQVVTDERSTPSPHRHTFEFVR
jgi:hypothetical protein